LNRDSGIGRFHVITDETLQQRFSHLELARLATEGGADCIQYREKRLCTTRELVETARRIEQALRDTPAKLTVNDRVDVASAVGAAGIHLGPDDLEPTVARGLLGESLVIGATANNLEQALRMARQPIDYLGVGPVFGTRSKASPASPLGLPALAEIVRAVPLPVIAIGSITTDRVEAVLETGAHGVAVLSAVTCTADPREAARKFSETILRARSRFVAG
jgi:thiamine-phosphate pyrophosphorylase